MKRALLATLLSLVAVDHGSMQTPTAADGPWAGWAQCVLTAQFTGQGQTYRNQQTHTWVLTSSTPGPTSSSDIKQYAATWQVTGQGSRDRGQGKSEQWTTAGQPMPDTITIRLTAAGSVRIGGAAQLRSVGTTTGAVIPDIDEWPFPTVEGAATQTTIRGSAPQGLLANFPGAPGGTSSTVTCSWDFVRGGGAAPSPLPTPGGLPPARADAGPPPTIGPAPTASVAAGPSAAPLPGASVSTFNVSACTLRGPADPSRLSYALPNHAMLIWRPVDGASGYTVTRSDHGVLTPTPLSDARYRHDVTLKRGVRYSYFLVAHYPSGCGATEIQLVPDFGSFSYVAAKNGDSAGTVRVEWTVSFFSLTGNFAGIAGGVHLEGPGFPQSGTDIPGFGDPVESTFRGYRQVQGVPRGNQNWTLTIYWNTSEGRVTGQSWLAAQLVP